ncbi:MAG: Ribosomal large subunit pseudouridine synthase C [Chlamydiales bacterium]|nr:Ribosomal large subunit pseudouridine synthase C [Chlamydiales bacterium]
MKVLFYDNHLLVLHKPAGMLTQPNQSNELSLECRGKAWLKEKYQKPGGVFLEAVHRIDRPVSGVVVFARTSKALVRLQAFARAGKFSKHYFAVVEGCVEMSEGELEHFLLKGAFRTEVVSQNTPEAKRSLLKFHVLERREGTTVLEIELITGRYHQIRAQLAAIGHPIVGDQKYGSQQDLKNILLHHHRFFMPHPVSGEQLCLVAEIDFASI